ncbi:hypothetical protein [Mycolicibacter kumamotonensis]|uniref:hypothetical protein n=1 Tax=Mycolicibacter kumamotonensis TaxID=354243 RepID=UPI0010556E3C|nr:hypothetical protein [Mycolicibacter kumamotonensis]
MASSPHVEMSEVYTAASTKLGNINIPFPENFQGATATKLQEMNAAMNQFLASTADHLSSMGTITSTQGTADGDLDKAPKPKVVEAKENKAKVLEMRAKATPTSANKTAAKAAQTDADDTRQQREAALAKHEAASTETAAKMNGLTPPTAPNIPGSPTYDPSKPFSAPTGGEEGSGSLGDGVPTEAQPMNNPPSSSPSDTDGAGDPSTGGGPSSSSPSTGGGDDPSNDPSKAGTQLSGDNNAGQNPSALQQGQGQPQGQGAQPGGGTGAPSTGAGNMLGTPGATLPKDDKKKRDPKDDLPAYGAGAAAGGAAGAAAAAGGVGSSVSGVGTNTKISGAGLTAPTPIGAKGPIPGSPGDLQRRAGGMGGGGMGGMGGGGAGGGKSRKAEGDPSRYIDPKQVGADVLARTVEGGIVQRSNADYKSPDEWAGNNLEFDKDLTPDQNRDNNHR